MERLAAIRYVTSEFKGKLGRETNIRVSYNYTQINGVYNSVTARERGEYTPEQHIATKHKREDQKSAKLQRHTNSSKTALGSY